MRKTHLLLTIIFIIFSATTYADSSNGLIVKSKGKETIELRFNGRLQAQYDGLSSNEPGVPSSSHFYFRRLFLGAKAKLQNGISTESVFNLAGDDVSIDKAIIAYTFSSGIKGTIGYQKVPFGFEETTSSSKLQTIERSAINRLFADDIDFSSRHTGLFLKGKLASGFSYSAALVNDIQGEGSKLGGASNANNDLATFLRLQWKEDALTAGIDWGRKSNYMANNNTLVSENVDAYTMYINYKKDGLILLGEYFSGDISDSEVSGYSLRASKRTGAYEPVIRYAKIDAGSFAIDTDELIRRAPKVNSILGFDSEMTSLYLGVNYYYSKAVTFMAGYEQAEAESSEVDGFRARVQVLW